MTVRTAANDADATAAPGSPQRAAGGWRAARPLLRGPLRPLVTGQCLGQAADGLAQIAFAQFVVFEAGRGATPASLAALLAVTLLPFSLVGPFAGVLIDRWSRRRVLVVVSLVRAGLTLAAIGTVVARSEPAAFVGVLLLLSTSRFVLAAKAAALPRTVPADALVTANAVSALAGMTSAFVGAVAGAALVAWSSAAGFLLATLLYLSASAAFVVLPDVGGGGGGSVLPLLRAALADVVDGVRTVRRTAAIQHPLLVMWCHRLLSGAGFVLLVLVADARFHLRIGGYGLAIAVTGLASFAGSLVAPLCARRWEPVSLLPAAFLPAAAAAYAGGAAPDLPVLLAGLAVTAFSFQLLKVVVDALVGGATPDAVRGRVFAVYDVLYNVGFVLAGLLLVPLWRPSHVTSLFWLLATGFAVGWLAFARLLGTWPGLPRWRPREAVARPWPGRLLALLAGALLVLALPAASWWWFAWVALVPVLLLVRSAPTAREGGVRAWWAGAGLIASTTAWLVPVMGPGLALVAALVGALWLPWGWAAHRLLADPLQPRRLLAALVVLPSGWVAVEAVRSWQSLGGPWALLGATQWNAPRMLASAALGGVWLTTFLVVLVNVAVVVALVSSSARGVAAVAGLLALAVGPAWSGLRPALPQGAPLTVAVVQPGVMHDAAARFTEQEHLTEALAARHPDLVVWSESSVGFDLQSRPDLVARLVALTRLTHADLLVNVDARRGHGIYKTSVLVTSSGLGGRYDKTRLVPFGEYIPMRDLLSWLSRITKAAKENRVRGHGAVVLHAGHVVLGPLICFESAFPDMARREVALGAQLVVYQTATSTFQGTWAQPQHASLAAVRAVETGRPVVHGGLTGVTAAFDATGHRLAWLPAGRRGTVVVTLRLGAGRTPYDVVGDWVLVLSAGVLAGALAVGTLRRQD